MMMRRSIITCKLWRGLTWLMLSTWDSTLVGGLEWGRHATPGPPNHASHARVGGVIFRWQHLPHLAGTHRRSTHTSTWTNLLVSLQRGARQVDDWRQTAHPQTNPPASRWRPPTKLRKRLRATTRKQTGIRVKVE